MSRKIDLGGRLIELRTASIETDSCVVEPGAEHDYRPISYKMWGSKEHTSLICVWCGAIACGDVNQPDPCIEVYHHRVPHRSRAGVVWGIGEVRPGEIEE